MLEVNDFNAIRIALASPEQIKSWSYGEVTKPETINYRTLKPEKDGLFCEKIFGPTKDFECYCGKYKRLRYKGIICDKCGVEVARSKVRRERMGHVSLASPVAHIWFVKGTPSRLGLLLDISPRSLERVLYFAQYIITRVDDTVRQRALEALRDEMSQAAAAREKEFTDRIHLLQASLEEETARFQAEREKQLKKLDDELTKAIDQTMKAANTLERDLAKQRGKSARKDYTLGDTLIAAKGGVITPQAIADLKEAAGRRLSALQEEFAARQRDAELLAEATLEERRQAAESEVAPLREKAQSEREKVLQEYQELMTDLQEIRDPIVADRVTLLSESRYRELHERFPAVFFAGMGAEALLEILRRLDLNVSQERLQQEIQSTSGQRRKKATKRLRVVEALRKSGNKPEWMVFTVLPVLPPDLRPMVQLDGGRFATSDLNDLYRRVINRNNRLKRLLELGAPEIIIRNEKRMLQEAVDSLIDNGRRGRAVSGQGNHRLKSLSDMLKGKQGRFRQNLLGKRVDYSGRSVIVVGPELKLHQCGLPKRMALELFKPFVMHALVSEGHAHNIKSAKRIVERARPEVWDILDRVIKQRPVLLNRAPTLHRLGIQAFEPVLIEGSAIQIHPLVCAAFNADFDGDQMAVHIPLSHEAVAEARLIMLSTKNLLLPSSGEPTVAPTLDIVLGCYYLTLMRPGARGEFREDQPHQSVYGSFQEARLAHELGIIHLQARIKARDARTGGQVVETTVGRTIFDSVLPPEIPFHNEVMDKKNLKAVVAECYQRLGGEATTAVVDEIKLIGFHYATQSGLTITVNDLKVPEMKAHLLEEADKRIAEIEEQFQLGLITDEERHNSAVTIWRETTDQVEQAIQNNLDRYGSVFMMATSGAKGNIAQIRQMAGMRGLMSDPSGNIIDLPIRSSFREGLSVLEYFISTHGARKGLADTALRTADSGYLTRRLIDVAQDVIILEEDCGTEQGVWIREPRDRELLEPLRERITGRWAAAAVADPTSGEVIVDRNQEIDGDAAARIEVAAITQVYVRSPLVCAAPRGICRLCYGRDLARGQLVSRLEAVGIIGAQSIGEPGTQLTMRTFHTGGVAGLDITSGLPRVEELFEARVPKGHAIISEIDGTASVEREGELRKVRVVSAETYSDDYQLPGGLQVIVKDGQQVEAGAILAQLPAAKAKEAAQGKRSKTAVAKPVSDTTVAARISGTVRLGRGRRLSIAYEEKEEREYLVTAAARIRVESGSQVQAGQQLTDGPVNPQDILHILGKEATQLYLVEEVQKVYRSQGVNINDKHIEVIVRQMLRRVQIDTPGDADYLPGELVDLFAYERKNAKVLAEGGEPATARPVLLGVTKASLHTDSFLAAASFQETTRVLTEAAIAGRTDRLQGLKENVIIGKLIPARALENFTPEEITAVAGVAARPALPGAVPGEGDLERMLRGEAGVETLLTREPGFFAETAEDQEEEGLDLGEEEPAEPIGPPSAYIAEPEPEEEEGLSPRSGNGAGPAGGFPDEPNPEH